MRVFLAALACVCVFAFSVTAADAHARHHHHKRHHHHHYTVRHSLHGGFDAIREVHAGLTRAKLDSGQVIVVATTYESRFVGFLNAVYHREGSLPDVECYSPTGHMRNSLHHWGGACDVGQRSRNVAWKAMYHIGDLAREYGLTDGCIWHNPDCGHVDVSGVGMGVVYRHYARHRYRHYAKG